ncbi:MAG: PAS domain-containing sensor histidine kinase [Candidatus Thermoplasmatota archaeon]|nr:PAS domain-containing sensor histidine kinase [Euryarchaeota archaeon]MBU4031860.1 PAS domain-containing sensor histidine kinase [Candidatus Thermoplasmatota archaeon]MBU4072367.1 PAS domain-containing sensor histidine kinase [Candidatus Thermoplasmatota archaeon]MBU4143839.1 PAS domain-containing sensor histidine kinase [Candidatus Thermoplasmatota archaeon]MBU4591906.1 PAS domain-containing sensor histidine kinase [Candidatus Thermoplasmatota archaeon]
MARKNKKNDNPSKPPGKSHSKKAPPKTQFTEEECNMLYDGERFKILFEESLDVVYITNRDGIIMDLNKAGCELLGYSDKEVIGKEASSLFSYIEDTKRLAAALAVTGRVRDFEATLKKKDGSRLICLINSFVRKSQSGKILGYQGIFRDITKSRHLELRLKTEFERAEFYNDLMSHDINNFNQGALSNLELLLLSGELTEKGERYARNAIEQISGSATLILNMKKLQAIKSGELMTEKVNALELLDDAVIRSRALFPGRTIDINMTNSCLDGVVIGNRLLLEAFINLITNAIKFNRNSIPEIHIMITENESGFLKLEFRDNGPGIDDAMKQKVFDRSLRLHPEVWGTGLGLTLVKSIIESYGGSISVKDRVKGDPSQGSNFTIILRRGN